MRFEIEDIIFKTPASRYVQQDCAQSLVPVGQQFRGGMGLAEAPPQHCLKFTTCDNCKTPSDLQLQPVFYFGSVFNLLK